MKSASRRCLRGKDPRRTARAQSAREGGPWKLRQQLRMALVVDLVRGGLKIRLQHIPPEQPPDDVDLSCTATRTSREMKSAASFIFESRLRDPTQSWIAASAAWLEIADGKVNWRLVPLGRRLTAIGRGGPVNRPYLGNYFVLPSTFGRTICAFSVSVLRSVLRLPAPFLSALLLRVLRQFLLFRSWGGLFPLRLFSSAGFSSITFAASTHSMNAMEAESLLRWPSFTMRV